MNRDRKCIRTRTRKKMVGQVIRWEHGPNVLTGTATHYDADDDEFYIIPDGLVHGHCWVPASECTVVDRDATPEDRDVPTTCAWCYDIARGASWHNDGMLYPSCGKEGHGREWYPDEKFAVRAPSADERETLIALRLAAHPMLMSDGTGSVVVRSNEEAADVVLAAGFRRRGPEPSDAAVLAALTVYDPLIPPASEGNSYVADEPEKMRAALRAAYEAETTA